MNSRLNGAVQLTIELRTISEHVQNCERDIITLRMLEMLVQKIGRRENYPLDHATESLGTLFAKSLISLHMGQHSNGRYSTDENVDCQPT
jgi:hypothetical protein